MTSEPTSSTRPRRVLGWCLQLVAWMVMLGFTALIVLSVLVPRVIGGTPYVILTGSMRPTMPAGSLVVTRPMAADKVAVGSVVTYQLSSGRDTVVTHRVHAVGFTSTGAYRFTTQGDANDVADSALVRPVQVRGVRAYSVPYLGYLTARLTGQERHIFTLLFSVGLAGYATAMFAGALRDRRRTRHGAAPCSPTGRVPA